MPEMGNTRFVRRTGVALALMALTFPLVGWGAMQGLHRLNDDAISWTSPNLAARRDFEWFIEHFGSQNAILVSWPGATLDDPRSGRFAQAIRHLADAPHNGRDWFREVVTGAEVYRELTTGPLGCSHREAIRRLRGTFIGPDGRATCVAVLLSEDAVLEARGVLQAIREVAQQHCGVDPAELRMVGYVVETATIDDDALNTLYWLSLPSALVVILIAWPCLRSLRLALLVWLSATFCQCLCLASVFYLTGQMNGMMTILPILLLVIFVSSAVHLINYYQDAVVRVGPAAAPAVAVSVGWFPCSLAVVTTAIGIGSLALSRTAPVRSFGVFAAMGTLSTLLVLFLVLPGGMHLAANPGDPTPPRGNNTRRRLLGMPWSWDPWARLVRRHSTPIVLACVSAAVIAGFGLASMKGSMQLNDMQRESSRIMQDHLWFQQNIGPLLPVEIVLRFDRNSPWSMGEKLAVVRRVEEAVRSMPGPTSTVSLAAFLPRSGTSWGMRSAVRRTVINRRLERQRAQLAAASPYLADTGEAELWRITVGLEGLDGRRYEQMMAELRRVVDPVLRDVQQRGSSGFSIVYTGTVPLLAASHPTLIRDLVVSFSVSLLLIAVVLVFGLQSFRLGLLSVLPNVFPIVLVFGALGHLGRSIDVGSMMTASVGLGIAVDGTVHYLTWFTRGIRRGLSRHASILDAYRHSAVAMLRTTAICGAGLAVYATSGFLPAARFGCVVCVLLLAALVGDLLLLPALLAGRLGRVLFPDGDQAGTV